MVHLKGRRYNARYHKEKLLSSEASWGDLPHSLAAKLPSMVLVQASRTVGQMVSYPHVITGVKRHGEIDAGWVSRVSQLVCG